MNINFSTEEMIKALTEIGYEVKLESTEYTMNFGNHLSDITKEVPVYNVYRYGEQMISSGTGDYRLKWVFEQELKNRVLGLFASPETRTLYNSWK